MRLPSASSLKAISSFLPDTIVNNCKVYIVNFGDYSTTISSLVIAHAPPFHAFSAAF